MTWHWRTRDDGGDAAAAIVTVDGRTRLMARPHQFSAVWTVYDGVHEWEELQFCLRYLRPDDHFVDVGANVGVFSTLVGTRIPGVRITAVEPFPPVREDLMANLALNDLEISVVDAAVSDEAGNATFEVLGRDVLNRLAPDGGGGGGITVPVTTLDELVGSGHAGADQDRRRGFGASGHEGGAPLALGPGGGTRAGVRACGARGALRDLAGPGALVPGELGYRIHLLDGKLTPWHSDAPPPTLNVIACRRHRAWCVPGSTPPAARRPCAPVRVDVDYRSRSA